VTGWGEKKGLLIFTGLMVLVIVAALAAYQSSGNMGIEERFNNAVGIVGGGEAEGSGGSSRLALEGSPLLYMIVLGILVVSCYAVWRRFRV
jgi:hypothetical protein